MRTKGEFINALELFAKEVGVPTQGLVSDPSGEQSSKEVQRFARECQMKLKLLEESTQHANLAERYIGILKSAVRNDLQSTNCPLIFWDYFIEWRV